MPWYLYRLVLSGGGGEKSNRLPIHQRGAIRVRALPDSKRMPGLRVWPRGLWGVGRLDQPGEGFSCQSRPPSSSIA